jgi:hypothetical protein
MITHRWIAHSWMICVALLAPGWAKAASTAPAPTTAALYGLGQSITSVSSSAVCGGDVVGQSKTGLRLYWPGPGLAGATIYEAKNTESQGVFKIGFDIIALPKTPAGDGQTASGSFTDSFYGTPAEATVTGTAAITVHYVNANAFYVQVTVAKPGIGGTCTEKYNMAAVRTGK